MLSKLIEERSKKRQIYTLPPENTVIMSYEEFDKHTKDSMILAYEEGRKKGKVEVFSEVIKHTSSTVELNRIAKEGILALVKSELDQKPITSEDSTKK